MATDPVTAGLGILGLATQSKSNHDANNRAQSAQASQDALVKRQTDLFDRIFGAVQEADKAGAWDPNRRVAAMDGESARYESRDAGNLAGALRTAGYKPGDSELGNRLDAVKLKYQDQRAHNADAIRQESVMGRLQAYNMANPNALNTGIQVAGQQQQNAQSQVQSPGGIIAGLAPYVLPQEKQQPAFKLPTGFKMPYIPGLR